MPLKAKVTFCAGTESVTGANFLFEADGKKILIDCGLEQSNKLAEEANWKPFAYNPAEIDILFITHAHIDHIGLIPKLIHEGFKGIIYSTLPTHEITKFMLDDTAGILSKDREHNLRDIYSEQNLKRTFELWKNLEYYQKFKITENLSVEFLNAGHILGSAMVKFHYSDSRIVFTGDLGNSPSSLLPDTDNITDATYLVMESVYGDRIHEDRNTRKDKLEDAIEDNVKRKGVLLIPTFSLERSQELLFEIGTMIEGNRIPLIPILFDSPLAIKLTTVFRKYTSYFKKEVRDMAATGDDLFMFPGLQSTLETDQSKMIIRIPLPKVIIAGSGMSSGGRILHHEQAYLPDPKSTLLLTGYQGRGTLGRLIEDGAKTVHISGQEVTVRARVVTISGYSGHKDSDGLIKFVEATSDSLKKVFVVMGEPKSSMFLVQKLRDNLGINAYPPKTGETVELDF